MNINTEYIIRPAVPRDLPRLKSIWQVCFGDSEAETDCFFDTFFDECSALIISSGGQAVAAAYILYISELSHGGQNTPCPYIYGVGVLPRYRGRGFGARLTNAAVRLCRDKGYELCCLVPASGRLFEFYRKQSGFSDFFTVDEHIYISSQARVQGGEIERIAPEEYGSFREHILRNLLHMRFSPTACRYMEQVCSSSGGGLFRLNKFKNAVAAAYLEEDTLHLKELLCRPEDTCECIKLLTGYFGAAKCIARTPGTGKPFGMLKRPGSASSPAYEHMAYMGFAFD
ncbi:MAG: GNAT family N-acetyltransferase [Clostridiales bacterium]|jgi:ribosomal protein S18 acetylase RimI-like enzyme|nr:GNAT family N-acetyltransferase [Clostridiales bacterium]